MDEQTTMVIADPHAMVREGLRAVLEGTGRFRIVGEAGSGDEAVELARLLKPEIVLLAFQTPEAVGLRAIRELGAGMPHSKVLVLLGRQFRHSTNDVLSAGAMGCISKTRKAVDLVTAVDFLAAGRMYVPKRAAPFIRGRLQGNAAGPEARLTELNATERDVLKLTAMGFTETEIAARIFLAPKSIQNAKARVRRKLGLRTRADLVSFALDSGILRWHARD